MKKMMMIAAMMIAAVGTNAQNEVGQITLKPTVGLNIAKMTKADDGKVRPGFVAGVEAEYGVLENLGITAGVFYSQQGIKAEGELAEFYADDEFIVNDFSHFKGKATIKLDYINIPILAQYYVIPGLAVKAGVQPGFCVNKKINFNGTVEGSLGDPESIDVDYKFEDGIKSFYLSIPVGVSYEYRNFVLDARYNIGVTKVYKAGDSRHSVFSFTIGYKFAL